MQSLTCGNCGSITGWLIGVCAADDKGRQVLHLMCQNCRCVVKMKVTPAQMNQLQSDGALLKSIEAR